jgi:hypothetical protein
MRLMQCPLLMAEFTFLLRSRVLCVFTTKLGFLWPPYFSESISHYLPFLTRILTTAP